jgi:hypothetical protein
MLSFIVGAAAVALLIFMLIFDGLQKKHLGDINNDISTYSNTLKNEPQINKILTVQNQLQQINSIESKKPAATRLFTYLNEITPVQDDINNLSIDFTMNTVSITGGSDSLKDVNTFVDTLKYTNFTQSGSTASNLAFSNVVLTTFSRTSQAENGDLATYTITFSFNPVIFNITDNITLQVPSIVTTRSEEGQPSDLFKAVPTPSTTPITSTTSGGN